MAYIMRRLGVSYVEALQVARKHRPIVTVNLGFEEQLELWARMEYRILDGEGAQKALYQEWKQRWDELLKKGEEVVSRERVKSMAVLVARVGGMRKENEGDGEDMLK